MAEPKVGEDGLVFEDRPLSMSVLQSIPSEIGLWKTPAVYTSLEASSDYIVIGSQQGLVWVVDVGTAKLLREFSDFRGESISVLSLSPTRDLVAYGTSGGHVKIEKVSRPGSSKWRFQEKSKKSVGAIEWNGDNLFCGFEHGRVIRMRLNIHDGTMASVPLPENFGSQVIQLSAKGNSLLVGTVERTWIVDTETHKLEQVGRKDRKPGAYGGCLIGEGDTAYVARPGLRLWTADKSGTVLRTVVFKEPLSTQHIPRVPLHSWSSLIPAFNKSWQFSTLHSWVGEQFVVSHSDHNLFILDPQNGLVVGVLTLGQQITDISVAKGFLYILCNDLKKPVCRISVKQSFLKALKKKIESPNPVRRHLVKPEATVKSISPQPSEQASKPTISEQPPLDTTATLGQDNPFPKTERKDDEIVIDDCAIDGKADPTTEPDHGSTNEMVDLMRSTSLCEYEDDTESIDDDQRPSSSPPVGDNSAGNEQCLGDNAKPEGTPNTPLEASEQSLTTSTQETSENVSSSQELKEPLPEVNAQDDSTVENIVTGSEQTTPQDEENGRSKEDSPQGTQSKEPASESSAQSTEPSLQEHLQHMKSDMKELFNLPIGKLSNIFKPASGSLSPGKLRVLASRGKKTADDEHQSAEQQSDLSVQIEENTVEPTQKDDLKTKPDLKEILKLARIGNLLNKDPGTLADTPTVVTVVTPAPLEPEEQERRLRMAAGNDDQDDIVVVKEKKRKKRKRKTHKKLSSATSSLSTSLERLVDIEEEYGDSPNLSAIATPISRMESPGLPFLLTEEQTRKLEQLKSERNEELPSLEPTLESLPEAPVEDDVYVCTGDSCQIRTESKTKQHIKTENVTSEQRLPDLQSLAFLDELGLDTVTNPPPDSTPDFVLETDTVAVETDTFGIETDANTPDNTLVEQLEQEDGGTVKSLFDDDFDTPKAKASLKPEVDDTPLFSDNESPPSDPLFMDEPEPARLAVTKHSKSNSPFGESLAVSEGKSTTTQGDLSDNPLYFDAEPEQKSSKSHSKSFDSDSKTMKYQSSLLQPVQFDPLQSDESYEYVFTHGQDDKLIDSTPVTLEQRHHSASPELRRDSKRRPRPQPVVSGSWTGYGALRNSRELSADASDSSHDDDEELNTSESEVVPDFYKLCGSLVRHSNTRNKTTELAQATTRKLSLGPGSQFQRESVHGGEFDEDLVEESPVSNADIWVPIPHPGRSHLQCLCLSDTLLWVVDGRGTVFCTSTRSKGKDWQLIKRSMAQISSSSSGKVVWGIHHHNAYVRLGIGMNEAGSTWKNATKGTVMSRKIKKIAVSENSVWAITTDNRTIFRKGITESNPEGRVWQEVAGMGFSHISACADIVWAHTSHGKVFIREGITPSVPSGKKWLEYKCPKLITSCLTSSGVAWGINNEGSIGFRCNVTSNRPTGKGPWWEVKVNALTHPSSPYNSLWQVMGAEGSHVLTNILPHMSQQSKAPVLAASSRAGVIILQDSNRLHACWRTTTGFHYKPASKDGLFPLTVWSKLASGSTGLWLVRDDGDLYCLTSNDKLKRIDGPAAIQHLASSPTCLWIVAGDLVWSRQGLGQELPEGNSFDYIEVSPQLHERKIKHISCGKMAVWALDQTGVPHFRFGVHSREPGTGMSPAWIPVEDNPGPMTNISVCPDNWLVWGCDHKFNCYVRTGVTHDFPIGCQWEHVPSEQIKQVCCTNEYVYALTPTGELLCRYGVSEENVQGNYWRRMPGRYEHLTAGRYGELWTLDSKGQVWKQEWKILAVSQDPQDGRGDFEDSMVVDQSWEVV